MIITVTYWMNGTDGTREQRFNLAELGADGVTMAAACIRTVNASDTLTLAGRTIDAICDYCDQPATRITREGAEVLCRECTHDQYSDPKISVSPLAVATLQTYGMGRSF